MRGTSWLVLTKAGIILSDSVNDPVNISAQSGVHPWVALPSTALTPGHYSYLSVRFIQVTPPDHGTTTVSLTSIQDPLIIPGAHHVLRDLTGSVPGKDHVYRMVIVEGRCTQLTSSIKKIDDVEIVESGDDGDDDYEVMDSVHAVYPKCSGNKAHICSYQSREIGEY